MLAGNRYFESPLQLTSKKPLSNRTDRKGPAYALLAAALVGASTPFAKLLLGHAANSPRCLALFRIGNRPFSFDFIVAQFGRCAHGSLAWLIFKENFDLRIALGMIAIIAGGVVLSWAGKPEVGIPWGPIFVAGACLAWAIDNNLTRNVSARSDTNCSC